jgi:uncharacterized protein YehS (DUF1456 family)
VLSCRLIIHFNHLRPSNISALNLRNIILISVIGLLILLLVVKPYPISRLPFFPISGVEAIPANASLCFEMEGLQSLRAKTNNNSQLEKLAQMYIFQQFNRDFNLLEQLLQKDSSRLQRIGNTPLFAVMQNGGLDAVNYLFILEMSSQQETTDFKNWISALPGIKITSTVYKNEQVYKVQQKMQQKDGSSFSFVVFRNLLLVGRYPLLIEDAINQLKVAREPMVRGWMGPKVLALPKPLRVYLRPSNVPLLLQSFLNKRGKDLLSPLYDSDELIAVDVLFEKNGIAFQNSIPLLGKSDWYRSVRKQKGTDRSKFAEILPAHTALIQWLSASDLSVFSDQHKSENFKKYFQPWLGKQAALVTTEPYSINLDAENFLLLEATDMEKGEHFIQKLGEVEGELASYEYMTYTIRRIMIPDFFDKELWPGFELKNPFVTFINGFLVAAQSQQALEVWIDKYNAGQTLNNAPAYLSTLEQLDASAKWWAHVHTDNARQLLATYLRKEEESGFNEQFDIVKALTPMDIIINEKGALKGFFSYQGKSEKSTSILWKTRLAQTIIGTPKVIEYDNSKQFQVLVQDQSNLLYMLNSGGGILWKKQLDGPILSDIQGIDYYKNSQIHFLFNTAGSIYLFDADGKDVSNFPILLRSKATNGVLAVDFDGLKEYSFFVACENDKLYGFQKTGRPLDGWPQSGVRKVALPIRHFQQDGKDYLAVLNTIGKLMVFDKKGARRFADVRWEDETMIALDYDSIAVAPRIVAVNKEGQAKVVNMEGAHFKLNLEVGNNTDVQFALADVVGDARKDFLVSSQQQIACYFYDEKNSFSKRIVIDIKDQVDQLFPVPLSGKPKTAIGTLNKAKEQINLYNAEGKRIKDFPLAGTTPFQIIKLFKSGEHILITGKGDSVFVYRMRS